ncbi:hypothetical protein CesoFtcFv8_026750 [Champsocephalus esox]|uniref:Lipocalin n=1 Tax=Champsocephalus esox TaxID=159716 RepID=A0AAN8AZV7_9TELE|nr:hypothetical protein CesoFtcFv8_026750 [Champsocephalus esox]
MGHTFPSLLGVFLLSLLYRGQAQDAVLTIEPNWTTFFTGESVTFKKSKDSCYSRYQKTNQGPATDHMTNQDETNQREYASVLQDDACLYATVRGPEEPANDESTDVTYSVLELKHISKKGKSSPAPADETVYSELKPGTALGKNAA